MHILFETDQFKRIVFLINLSSAATKKTSSSLVMYYVYAQSVQLRCMSLYKCCFFGMNGLWKFLGTWP